MNLFNRPKQLTAWSTIQMKANKTAEINISGFIGCPEWWQFDADMEKEYVSTKEKMQAELKEISNLKADTIKVNIDSLGGDVNHGQSMYSALAKNPANIEVEYTGWSASIATIIAAAATDNNITMSNTNMILIHQARGCACGVSSDMSRYASWLDKINGTMAGVYSDQTGNTKEEMTALMNENNGDGEWLTASEALEVGLIKHITEPMRAAAHYDLSRLEKFGYKVPQNKLNSLNMNLRFGKKEDTVINSTIDKDGKVLLHEGELKVDSEVQLSGATTAEGDYPLEDGRTIKVNAENVVSEIVEVQAAATNEGITAEQVTEIVAQLLVDSEAKTAKLIADSIAELRSAGSTKKVPKIKNSQSIELEVGTQASAQANMRKLAADIQKKKEELANA